MPIRDLNRLTAQLGSISEDFPIQEKWLLAPSRRIGFQWLDAVTLAGQPVLNVRVKTVQHAALDLAMPELERLGKTYVEGIRAELLVQRIFVNVQEAGRGYFTVLDASPGLMKALLSTIRDLRLSGIKAADLKLEAFEVKVKGLETKEILGQYEEALQASSLADYADVLRIAAARVQTNPLVFPKDAMILIPEDLRKAVSRLEEQFLEAFPKENLRILPEDDTCDLSEDHQTDRALLGRILTPTDAPSPKNDGTASIFRAIGEVNEVREVFRRCAERCIPLDEVEILHTDAQTYVPLIYELAWRLKPEESASIPATFAEGIPTRYSRPGRALTAWLSWIRNDYPQWALVRMIQDGILRMDKAEEEGFSFPRLAAALKGLPIGSGAERYLQAIDAHIQSLDQQHPEHDYDENDVAAYNKRRIERIEGLRSVRRLVEELLQSAPKANSSQKAILEAADWLLDKYCRCGNQLDEYSKGRLLKKIRELAACLEGEDHYSGFDVWDWLSALPNAVSVGGIGPRPGCLFVAPLHGGGHSGRSNTFIIGLDDTRFPGAGLQDPLLLDSERGKISTHLPTASNRAAKKMNDFLRLLARVRGTVTLGYCCRSLEDDREMFPSPVLISGFRILSGEHTGDQDAFLRWLPDPTSFAAQNPEQCTDITEWWLWLACGDHQIQNAGEAIARSFPHLNQGMAAELERQSDRFTEYDGHVPQAGLDNDPTSPDGPVLSASRLEKLGSCPMGYFFQFVLKIAPPEEYEIDPSMWLDPLQKGTLLHSVFREFMARLREKNLLPNVDRDASLMNEILSRQIALSREAIPLPNEEVFKATVNELRLTTQIFLQEEADFCTGSTPVYLEAAIGTVQDEDPTLLDTVEPVSLLLSDGKAIRVRGRVDRIDQLPNDKAKVFTVWDYKTGSAWGYDRRDPFLGGRRVQSTLYCGLVEERLRKVHPPNPSVASFGYFFPSLREHGERISWTTQQLVEGREVIAELVEMLRTGCFPFTNDAKDVRYSDYRPAFGDVQEAAQAMDLKLNNPDNIALLPFQNLRT